MLKGDIDQVRRSISLEYFETFDENTQLNVLQKLQDSIDIVRACEQNFSPDHFEELRIFLENRLNELQIIYNIKTNKTLNDF